MRRRNVTEGDSTLSTGRPPGDNILAPASATRLAGTLLGREPPVPRASQLSPDRPVLWMRAEGLLPWGGRPVLLSSDKATSGTLKPLSPPQPGQCVRPEIRHRSLRVGDPIDGVGGHRIGHALHILIEHEQDMRRRRCRRDFTRGGTAPPLNPLNLLILEGFRGWISRISNFSRGGVLPPAFQCRPRVERECTHGTSSQASRRGAPSTTVPAGRRSTNPCSSSTRRCGGQSAASLIAPGPA